MLHRQTTYIFAAITVTAEQINGTKDTHQSTVLKNTPMDYTKT
jgi:hypothetical protein